MILVMLTTVLIIKYLFSMNNCFMKAPFKLWKILNKFALEVLWIATQVLILILSESDPGGLASF